MIHGLDGPEVVVPARAAALLAKPIERLVADARRRGEPVDESVLAVLVDFERVRRLGLAQAAGSASGTPEPDSAEPGVQREHDPHLSTKAAAELLGYSTSYLRRLARAGRIGDRAGGSDWRFAVADVAILAADRARSA